MNVCTNWRSNWKWLAIDPALLWSRVVPYPRWLKPNRSAGLYALENSYKAP